MSSTSRWSRWPVYPFLLAIWPPLALAAKNPMEVARWSDLPPAMAAGMLAAMIVFILAWLLAQNAGKAAVAAAVAVLGFWWYRDISHAIGRSIALDAMGLAAHPGLLLVLMFAGLSYLAARRVAPLVTRHLMAANVFSLVLVGIAGLSLGSSGIRPGIAEVIGPSPARPDSEASPGRPDVYILVLDSYAGQGSLLRDHDFDNTPFLEALRSRGFHVPAGARANYTWTLFAVASMLNWEYVQDLPEMAAIWPPSDARELIPIVTDNRTVRGFLERGYEFIFVPSSAWFLNSHPWADSLLSPATATGSEFSVFWRRMTLLPEIRRTYCRLTSCPPLKLWKPEAAAGFDQKFSALATLAAKPSATPRLVVAHFMLPHDPYVYTRDCRQRDPVLWPDVERDPLNTATREAYTAQVECLNTRIVALVDEIMRGAAVPPVIVLQGDHGQRYRLGWFPEETAMAEGWFDIFAAYLVPSEVAVQLPDNVTPVNAFRLIFGGMLNKGLQPLPEQSFVTPDARGFQLHPWPPLPSNAP